MEAVRVSKSCGMHMEQYGDEYLLFPGNEAVITSAVENDQEIDLNIDDHEITTPGESVLSREEVIYLICFSF
jgi:hypothetical protein